MIQDQTARFVQSDLDIHCPQNVGDWRSVGFLFSESNQIKILPELSGLFFQLYKVVVSEFLVSISSDEKINSLPNNNILDKTKSKAFADDKIYATQKLKPIFGRVKNIVG